MKNILTSQFPQLLVIQSFTPNIPLALRFAKSPSLPPISKFSGLSSSGVFESVASPSFLKFSLCWLLHALSPGCPYTFQALLLLFYVSLLFPCFPLRCPTNCPPNNHICLHKYKFHYLYNLSSKENGRDISCQVLNHVVLKSSYKTLIPRSVWEIILELLKIVFKITLLIYGQILTHIFPNYMF